MAIRKVYSERLGNDKNKVLKKKHAIKLGKEQKKMNDEEWKYNIMSLLNLNCSFIAEHCAQCQCPDCPANVLKQ